MRIDRVAGTEHGDQHIGLKCGVHGLGKFLLQASRPCRQIGEAFRVWIDHAAAHEIELWNRRIRVGSYEARRHSACGQFLDESIARFREATAAAEIDDLILQFGRLAFFLGFLQIDGNAIRRMFQIAGLNHQQPMCRAASFGT
jgi:hypothetical protein